MPEAEAQDVDALAATIVARARQRARSLVALAGPPGSGKSTLAEALAARIGPRVSGGAAVVAMDGFHLDDRVLVPRGWRTRKGAPHTFDVGGLAALLDRLARNLEDEIAVPVFDRDLEIARAGARLIPRSVSVLIVEGNYLLLDAPGWRDLAHLFDLTVMIRVGRATLRRRLDARWRGFGLAEAEVRAKVDGNDLPNADLVMDESRAPDFWLAGETAP